MPGTAPATARPPQPRTPLERLHRYDHLTLQATLGMLAVQFYSLEAEESGYLMGDIFATLPEVPGIVILQDGEYLGLMGRRRYMELMADRFGRDLFARRPLGRLLATLGSKGLVLSSDDRVELAASVALLRPQEEIYDPVVVRFPDKRFGLLDVQEILLAQTRIVESAERENRRLVSLLEADLKVRQSVEHSQVIYNRRLIRQTAALEKIARLEAVRASDLDAAAPDIVRLVGEALRLDRTALWLFSVEKGGMVLSELACHDVLPGHVPPPSLPLEEMGPYLTALNRDRTLMVPQVANDPRLDPLRATILEPGGIVGILHVLLQVGQRPIAILRCELRELRQWAGDELNFVDAALNFIALLSIGQERARAIRAQLESEARFERMFETSPVGICVLNPDGSIQRANPQLCRFFDRTHDELARQGFAELYAEPRRHAELLARFRRDGHVQGEEVAFRTGVDQRRWTVMSWEPLPQGGTDHIVVWLFDVTMQKKAEESLRQAKEQAEAATRAKSSYLATMSHEIRTPMNGVLGMLDLVKRTTLTHSQRRTLSLIEESAQSLLRIIDDILDFSKIEAGKLEIESVPFSVAEVVEGVAATLAPGARRKGLRVLCAVDTGLPPAVMGDPVRVRQVLVNLLGNAIKFTMSGHVCVRVRRLPRGPVAMEERLRFTVEDTGIGLTEAQIARLFQPFAQAEISTSRRFGGTGLGLSICRMLVSLMGGRLGVESVPGQGSRFWVELSLAPADRDGAKPTDLVPLDALSVRLSLDHADEAAILSGYLMADGARVLKSEVGDDTRLVRDDRGEKPAVLVVEAEAELEPPPGTALVRLKPEDKPLRRAVLNRMVAAAAGKVDPSEVTKVATLDRLPSPPAEPILIVDDHPINREVITRQLEQLGCKVAVASNGEEALAVFDIGRYALVLTDCEMPVMDGLALARAIRRREAEAGGDSRVPIVALTANALGDQHARCLDAGMDDCLIKPIDTRRLGRSLVRWFPPDENAPKTPPEPPPVPTPGPKPEPQAVAPPAKPQPDEAGRSQATAAAEPPPISLAGLVDLVGNDKDALRALLTRFLKSTRPCYDALDKAVRDGGEVEAVRAESHRLKGAAAMVGANALAQSCHQMESAARAGDSATFPALQDAIAGNWRAVVAFIEGF